jgi:hypothetical protein
MSSIGVPLRSFVGLGGACVSSSYSPSPMSAAASTSSAPPQSPSAAPNIDRKRPSVAFFSACIASPMAVVARLMARDTSVEASSRVPTAASRCGSTPASSATLSSPSVSMPDSVNTVGSAAVGSAGPSPMNTPFKCSEPHRVGSIVRLRARFGGGFGRFFFSLPRRSPRFGAATCADKGSGSGRAGRMRTGLSSRPEAVTRQPGWDFTFSDVISCMSSACTPCTPRASLRRFFGRASSVLTIACSRAILVRSASETIKAGRPSGG